MDKIEFRAVIIHFWLAGKTPTEILNILLEVHGMSAPSLPAISFWVSEFKRGRISTSDEPRRGRPKTATNDEMVDKIHDVVLADQRLKLKKIAETRGISEERVGFILHEIFGMQKLSARRIPRLLTPEEKRNRVTILEECLARNQRNPRDFFMRFVPVDETWIHHYILETKEQLKQWTFQGESAPKKAKAVLSAGKVMATIFWDSQGVILIDSLQKERTIRGAMLQRFIDPIRRSIERETASFAAGKTAFSPRQCTSSFISHRRVQIELVSHSPYSPDLAPATFSYSKT